MRKVVGGGHHSRPRGGPQPLTSTERATAPKPLEVILYAHTHWDREWWATYQDFRFRLVHTVDRLLDVLETDAAFTCFVLDGQNIVLEDYLEIRRENRERLVRLIDAGRIHVGPWYVLADCYLVSGEALVRNLWLGERVARALGVTSRRIGYLPDQFGQPGQMPQILRGFGIDSAVVWRGFGAPPPNPPSTEGRPDDRRYPKLFGRDPRFPETMRSEFRWEATDGSAVLGIYLALEYYRGHAKRHDREEAIERFGDFASYMEPYSTTGVVLEPYGGDHLPVDPLLPATVALAAADAAERGHSYRIGSLQEYVDRVRELLPEPEVTWRGEGRAFGRRAHLLPGVLSSRLDLKQRNRDAQSRLERYAEPLQALNWMLGGRYEREYLWHAWRHLVQNHPHDSICGCSIDQVHREMEPRFAQAQQVGELLALRAAEELWAEDGRPAQGPEPQPVVVFNPLHWTRTEAVSVLLERRYGISEHGWILRDAGGAEVPFQARAAEDGKLLRYDHDRWTEVTFAARDLPGLGWRRYLLEPRQAPIPARVRTFTVEGAAARDKGAAETAGLAIGRRLLENEHLRVAVEASGTLEVLEKASGLRYTGLAGLLDGGDAGDAYNHSAPLADELLVHSGLASVSVVEPGPARATLRVTRRWELPRSLTEDRLSRSPELVPVEVHTDVSLSPGARRVDLRVHLCNPARDHRLQMTFPLGAPISHSSAESVFEVVDRPAQTPFDRGSAEPAVPEAPQQAFCSAAADGRGLTVANRGLPEFSASPDGILAVTLLRSVGWLSREDLLARIGGAGPEIATPDAQRLGPVEARLSIIPHAGTWSQAQAHLEAHAFNAEPLTVPVRPQGSPPRPPLPARAEHLGDEGSLLEIEGPVVLTALKRAEDSERLVVRVLNESAAPAEVLMRPARRPRRAFALDLREEAKGELELDASGAVRFSLAPWRLASVGFDL